MRQKLSFFSVIVGLLFPIGELQAGSSSSTVLFSAFFYGGSCEINAPKQLSYNNDNPIPDDSIIGDKRYRQFNVILAKCKGYFMTPRITVTGNTITTSDGVKLFADATSTTKGYGVRIAALDNKHFNANTNAAITNVISAKGWPESGSNNTASLDGAIEFRAYLSCGACTAGDNLQNGELIATVTFSFVYD
ncbi:fimbrial-like protein [Moellerella wisconsensis]|uniref:fimbrial-like protein n=1 Tax=Moellerella wisconsensis TaxID=158849 RepID=UPI0030764DD9